MSRSFLTSINLNKNQLLNAAIQSLSQAPQNPAVGQIYFDTGEANLRQWDGTQWLSYITAQNGDQFITAVGDNLDVTANTLTLVGIATDIEAQGYASTAEANANSYTDGQITTALSTAQGYANTAESNANSYTNGEITTALGTAAGYASTAESNAKTYADGLVQGLNVKDSVRAATSADANLASGFEAGDLVGGVTLAAGDRILVKDQATAIENGIYVVNVSGAPTRAADADPVETELGKGSYVLVTDGTYAATGWIVTAYAGGATTWTQFSAANEYTAGTNIAIVANQISFDGVLPVENGGTGADTAAGAKTNLGFITRYAANNTFLTASSGSVTWAVSHGLDTRDVTVQLFDLTTYEQVEVDVVRTSTSVVTLSWVSGDVSADAYRVVVVG
jgi:hypothetical protein